MKAQTAVEWIEGYLKKFNHIEDSLSLRMAFKKAKEIEKQQKNSKKCYHPLTERKHTSDNHFECTICGYNNY